MGSLYALARRGVLYLLLASLLLTTVRQSFDVIGRLWLSMLVNLVHMLMAIIGVFGAWQGRPLHLVASAFWMPLMLTWNVFLACLHLSVEPLSRHSTMLSFGSPLSRSFFVERMPLCAYTYDYARKEWHAVDECLLEYVYVEVGLSALHALVTFLAFDAMLVVLCTFPVARVAKRPSSQHRRSARSRASTRPTNRRADHISTTVGSQRHGEGRRSRHNLRTDDMTANGRRAHSSRPRRSKALGVDSLYEVESTARARSVSPRRRSDTTLETTHDDAAPFRVHMLDVPVDSRRRGSASVHRPSVDTSRGRQSRSEMVITDGEMEIGDRPISLASFEPKSITPTRPRHHAVDESRVRCANRPLVDSPPSSWDSGVVTNESVIPVPLHRRLPPLMSHLRAQSRATTPTQLERPGTAYDTVATPLPRARPPPPTIGVTADGRSATSRLAGTRRAPDYHEYNRTASRVPTYSRITNHPPVDRYASLLV